MANFVDCWGKLKKSSLNEHDRQSILHRIGEHLKAGVNAHEAAQLSVQYHLEDTQNQIDGLYKQAGVERGPKAVEPTAVRASQPVSLREALAVKPSDVDKAMDVLKSQPLNDEGERIESPAVRTADGYIHTGYGHWAIPEKGMRGSIEGFTTTSGRFLDREQAFKLASSYVKVYTMAHPAALESNELETALSTLRSQQTLDLFNDYAANLPARSVASKPALKEQVKKDVPALSDNEAALGDLFDLARKKLTNQVPTLRRGEKQGDLLSKQEEDLKLVGEKGIDYGARQSAKEESERALAEQDKKSQEKLPLEAQPTKGEEHAGRATTKTSRIRVGGGEHDTGGEGVSGELRPTERGQLSKEHATGRVKEILGNKAPQIEGGEHADRNIEKANRIRAGAGTEGTGEGQTRPEISIQDARKAAQKILRDRAPESGWHEHLDEPYDDSAWMDSTTGELHYSLPGFAYRYQLIGEAFGKEAADAHIEAAISEEKIHQLDRSATIAKGRSYGSLQFAAWKIAPEQIRKAVTLVYPEQPKVSANGAELIRMLYQLRRGEHITEWTYPWDRPDAESSENTLRAWQAPEWITRHLSEMERVKPTVQRSEPSNDIPETIGGKENALRQPTAEKILQRQPSEIGEAGGKRGRVEPGKQGKEVASAGPVRAEHLAAQPTQGQVYFVRHGTTTFNAETGQSPDRIRGHINVPLNANGARQAVQVGKDLRGAGITKIYTSDLSRAANTAGHISAQLENKPPVIPIYGLRPWAFGPSIEGKPTSEVMPKIKELVKHPDEVPPGGESFNQFKFRYGGTVERIKAENPNENIAIVTHYRGLKLAKSMDAKGNVDINEFTAKDDTIPPGSFQLEGQEPEPILRAQATSDSEKTIRQRFEENLPLANRIADKFSNIPGLERGDIQSKARTALLRASRAFDPSRGIPFNRLAQVSIRNELRKLYGEQVSIPEETTLERPLTETGLTAKDLVLAPSDVRNEVQRAEADRVLRRTISELPERMQAALNGILDGKTFPEIAQDMGVSKQGAQQLAVKAMGRIKGKLGERGVTGVHDLLSQAIDDEIKLNDDKDPMGALMDLLKNDPLEQLRKLAKSEEPGQKTVGQPKYALGAAGPEISAVQQFHVETATPQKFEQWDKDGDKILSARGHEWANDIVKRWTDGGFLDPAEVRATQKYLVSAQSDAKTPAEQRQYDAAAYAYAKIGEAVARQMASRRDPFKTPEERNREFLAKAVSWVNKSEQAELDGITDKTAKVARLQDMIAERRRQIDASLQYLTGKGVTLDDILSGGTELRLVGSKIIDQQMTGYSAAEQKALKLAQKGERSPAEIAKATGLTEKAIRDLNDAFISDLEKSLMPKTLAGATLENLDPMLLSQSPKSEARAAIPEEVARAEARKMIKAMGFVASKDLGKFKVSKRKTKPKIFMPPAKTGPAPEPPTPGELPTGKERQAPLVPEQPTGTPPAPGAVPYPQPAVAPYTGRVLGQIGLPLYQEMMIRKGADLGSPTDVARIGRIVAAAANGNRFDMLYEAWLSNILSGPTTHLSYKLALAANLGLEMTVQRGVEALVNLAVRDPQSAQIGEFPYIIKGLLPGITRGIGLGVRQFGAESELLEDDVMNQQVEAFEGPGRKFFPAAISERPISQLLNAGHKTAQSRAVTAAGESIDNTLAKMGKFNPVRGRVIRMPLRVLMFVQGLYAGLAHDLNVGAFAYRQAKAEGLKGDALANRITELVSTPGSPPHQKALDFADQITFRQPIKTREEGGNAVENLVAQFIRARSGSHLLGSQMPFVELPYNLFKTGLRKSPFGMANLLSRVTEAGFYKLKDGKPFFESYARADFNKHVAEQLIAWAVAALLWNMAWGDDDDEDKNIVVTGGMPTSTDMQDMRKSVRELYERAYGGPTQIIIGGRNGFHFNYGKYEPVATVLGTVVNTIHQLKHLVRGEQGVGDTLSGIWAYSEAQAEEKTFLRGLHKMMDSIAHPSQLGGNVKELLFSALVPNLIRQPLRNIDDYIRDYRTAPALYSSLPAGALAQPKIDVYGKPVQKQGNWFTRMFVQAGIKPDPVLEKADQLTLRYNLHHPQTPYAPSVPIKKYKDAKGKDVDMTPEQGTRFQVAVGKRFSMLLRGQITSSDVNKPSEEALKRVKEAHTRALEEVKREMFPRTEPRKVSQTNHVREMMKAA
jgi:RNA polymerase sigma factor (sigma-70 family)